MNVTLLSYTERPIETIYRAFKQCYAKGAAKDIKLKSPEEMGGFIKKWIGHGHESPIEHVSFTFGIEDVSRACQQQLTRHRLASYSIQSQRYVDAENFDFVIPGLDYIENDIERITAKKAIKVMLQNAKSDYDALISLGVKKEDARCVLPNATTGNIVVTMNLRSLRHFYQERSCIHAQTEIRELAEKMMAEVKEVIPFADYKCKKCGQTCFECK